MLKAEGEASFPCPTKAGLPVHTKKIDFRITLSSHRDSIQEAGAALLALLALKQLLFVYFTMLEVSKSVAHESWCVKEITEA